jgi:nucleoside 2-deoxyribosyltransferase
MQLLRVPKVRVFVLHAAAEAALADELRDALVERGAEVVSHDRLQKVQPWTSRLAEELRTCDLIVVLLSSTEDSRNLLFELGLAVATRGKERVVIVSVGDTAIPTDLAAYLYLRATSGGMEDVADRLLHAANDPLEVGFESHRAVIETLSDLGATWQEEPAVGGVRPDFLVEMPDGRRVVIEVKATAEPTVLNVADARAQAARIAEVAGADLGLAVFALPHLALEAEGAVGISDLPRALVSPVPAVAHREAAPEVVEQARTVFAAMPFAAEYEDVYFVAMVDAARAVGAACRRLDREDYAGDVVLKLTSLIGGCDVVIADISDANPNVMYEVGYAHALERPTVHICSTGLDKLPFDVRNWNTLGYTKGRTHALRDDLIRRLSAVIGE